MNKCLLTLLALGTLTLTAARAADMNVTLSDAQAESYTLLLGPGALATVTWPEPVLDVTVTRGGIVETKVVDNRVIIAGLTSNGNTPIQFTTESGVRTWRVRMSPPQSGSIVNVRVAAPDTPAVVIDDRSGAPANLTTFAGVTGTVALGLSAAAPSAPLSPAEVPAMRLTAERDGESVVVRYRLQAGSRGLSVDERQITTSSGTVRPTLSTLNLAPGEVRYGTVVVTGAGASKALTVSWPYRVGTSAQSLTQQLPVP